jgi:hypothetical protein
MPKFTIFATEEVLYMKEVEADSSDSLKTMIDKGEIDFDFGDVVELNYFQITEIEESKRYG